MHGRFHHSELVGCRDPFRTLHEHPLTSRKHAFHHGTLAYMSFRLPFEMFPFPSQGVFEGKKSTMAHIYDLPKIFQVQAVGFIYTMGAGLISLVRLPRQVAKCRSIIDGYEKQCSEVEILLFVLVPHTYTLYLPQQ